MATKRSKRASKLTKSKEYNSLVLSDVLCPICRSILIEPVSLPCNHEFCLFCFEGTMENANLVCPLCRLRIGSWLRKVRKDNTLINGDLWKAIKDQFPQSIKNKLDGVDENMGEKPEIIVSYPGEIRKEYELQKQKEEDQHNKKREAEIKASEELIKQISEEENHQKAAMDEKLKLDEEMAKKLAEELASKHPSTSKVKITYKKQGPLDKFIKKDNETTTLNKDTFIDKEYTCKVLCLDNEKEPNQSAVKEFSPKIQKKNQQIQKIFDLETASDGSDCIESEMRYFKPIDYKLNPPSQKKPPIKIVPKKLSLGEVQILSPGGLINFCSNILESAFARFSLDKSQTPKASKSTLNSSLKESSSLKRASSPNFVTPGKKIKKDTSTETAEKCKESPELGYNMGSMARKKLFKKVVEISQKEVESPPFYGFDRTKPEAENIRKNGLIKNNSRTRNLKEEQEQADLEFARRLQEEINKGHYTRSSRSLGLTKRQKTLDEMIKSPYRVK